MASSMAEKEQGKGEKMAKESAARKANKESPSTQDRAQNPGRKEGFNNGSGHEQKEGFTNPGGFGQKEQGNMMKESGKTKDGCLPKLFMLLMPFIAVGAYLLLRP
jgi:hypothetical protein